MAQPGDSNPKSRPGHSAREQGQSKTQARVARGQKPPDSTSGPGTGNTLGIGFTGLLYFSGHSYCGEKGPQGERQMWLLALSWPP